MWVFTMAELPSSATSEPLTDEAWRETRRVQAWNLHRQGWKQKDIAVALGVSAAAVNKWLKHGREGGVERLRHQRPSGTQPRLSPSQREQLRQLLALGPESFGFVDAVWTSKRVTAVIQRWFGVTYHRGHVSKLLRTLGIYVRVPPVWTSKRDEAVIKAWWDERWAELEHALPELPPPPRDYA